MITISKKSKKMIENIFSRYNYNRKRKCPKIFNNGAIIHIYPTRDTLQDNGDIALGYVDAILFDVHVYDTTKLEKYVISERDGILFEVLVETRIFKDLSTMYIINESFVLDIFKNIMIYPLGKKARQVYSQNLADRISNEHKKKEESDAKFL